MSAGTNIKLIAIIPDKGIFQSRLSKLSLPEFTPSSAPSVFNSTKPKHHHTHKSEGNLLDIEREAGIATKVQEDYLRERQREVGVD